MGKYMKKSKVTGDVATVMEVPQPPTATLGVRTRSRTLALQKLNSSSSPPLPLPLPPPSPSSLCYLQLRSRRLQKPAAFASKEKPRKAREELPREAEASFGENCLDSDPPRDRYSVSPREAEASFGENCLDSDPPRDRSTRESTPCTPIRDTIATGIPASVTRKTCSSSANLRDFSDPQRKIPPASELEEFFAAAERQQQKRFIEKYNFDVVNDCPLPGRYEWVKIVP